MDATIPADLRARCARWDALKRWERRELGQELRRLGLSYREIAAIIPVHKGTLSNWCRDIELSAEQQDRLRTKGPALAVRQAVGARRRAEHLARVDTIRRAARAEATSLPIDPLWSAGVVAYWAEGGKRSTSLRFSNSDPGLIRLFMHWAETYLEVDPDRFTASLHLHDGQQVDECIAQWSELTGIPRSRFGKAFIKKEGTGHRKNVLYKGTASIRVRCSGAMLQRVLGWIESYSDSLLGCR